MECKDCAERRQEEPRTTQDLKLRMTAIILHVTHVALDLISYLT